MFSLDAIENGSTTCAWTGVMGVNGESSPASLEAQDMEPTDGVGEIQDARLDDHELEGARPVTETGV